MLVEGHPALEIVVSEGPLQIGFSPVGTDFRAREDFLLGEDEKGAAGAGPQFFFVTKGIATDVYGIAVAAIV